MFLWPILLALSALSLKPDFNDPTIFGEERDTTKVSLRVDHLNKVQYNYTFAIGEG
jgi:hypothetical protein